MLLPEFQLEVPLVPATVTSIMHACAALMCLQHLAEETQIGVDATLLSICTPLANMTA